MAAPRRIRLSVSAAALSGALVVAMAGTDLDHPVDVRAVRAADPSGPHRLGGAGGPADGAACGALSGRAGDADAAAPVTTPTAAPGDEDDERYRDCRGVLTPAAAQAPPELGPGDR